MNGVAHDCSGADALAGHDTSGGWVGCWCLPKIYWPCDDCADEPSDFTSFAGVSIAHLPRMPEKPAGCWKCDHGLVPLPWENFNGVRDERDEPRVIVHDLSAERPTR